MNIRLSSLTLGTAQFGMRYGLAAREVPDDAQCTGILGIAGTLGITAFDTARVYGNSEERLGRLLPGIQPNWTRITKIPAIAADVDVRATIQYNIVASLAALQAPTIDICMFHRGTDVMLPGAAEALIEAIEAGQVSEGGVSVYTPDEAALCLTQSVVRHIQIPFNVLDSRWLAQSFQKLLIERPDVSVHARSVLLQGLLLMPAERWPNWIDARVDLVAALGALAEPLEGGLVDLCLRYHHAFPWIATTVIGVDEKAHVIAAVEAARRGPLPAATLAGIEAITPLVPGRLLNPSSWALDRE